MLRAAEPWRQLQRQAKVRGQRRACALPPRARHSGSSEAALGGVGALAHATAAFFLPAAAFLATLAAAAFLRAAGEASSVEAVRLMARSSSE